MRALPDRLEFGRLGFDVVRRPQRRTLEITVERDASLSIKAPDGATLEQITAFVGAKQDWIYRKLAEKDALVGGPVVKQFVNGEGFTYLGRNYRLLVVDDQDVAVKLERGRLCLRGCDQSRAEAVIRSWYSAAGHAWLRQRVRPWASRMRAEAVELRVIDLGYRWGSTRGRDRINIHWTTLQLRPSLIDYVLIHELAHLRESNHTPAFWASVERALPDAAARRGQLAANGNDLWLPCVN